jgi:hypothetical protein
MNVPPTDNEKSRVISSYDQLYLKMLCIIQLQKNADREA